MDWIYGKTILITGASSGLGRAMTLQLIREHGCMVLGIGQSEEKMKSLIEELSYLRDQFKYWIFDVSQEENWNTFREELTYNNINVDLLIIMQVCYYLLRSQLIIRKSRLRDAWTLILTVADIPLTQCYLY